MAQTLVTIRTNVRYHIDEPSANYWLDAELNAYISARELDLWKKIYSLKKDYWLKLGGYTLTLAVNKYTYETADGIPTDMFQIRSIRTTTSGFQDIQWRPVDPTSNVFIDGLRTDVPIVYPYMYMYALRNMNSLWVSPLPQSVLTAQIDYIQLPTPQVADSDTFLIPDPFLDYVEYMATADALSKGPVGDPVGWQQKASESWEAIKLALDTPRSDQGPDTVIGMFDSGGF